jgi:predicted nucleic acid-binding protein
MKGFLLDTNVPSELTRPHPQASVTRWLEGANDESLHISVISLGEIVKGIALLAESKRRTGLEQWLRDTLRPWFKGRILPVSESIAQRWGLLAGRCQLAGRPLKIADGLIIATALEHDLTVVTRNVRDFESLGAELLNPWN